jgi:cytochrome c biogenesis protein
MIRWQRGLWKFLGSRRLAVILLAALLLVLVLASLFPQMPAEPSAREGWLEAVNLRYGAATALLSSLGMFEAYRSFWFLFLLAALLLNTLICTVQRLPRLWRSLAEPSPIQRPEAFYQGFGRRAEWALDSLEQGLAAVQAILMQHRFSLRIEHDERTACASLYAEQGRWSQTATIVSHIAAVSLTMAIACRPALAWQESDLVLLPGEVHRIGHGYDLEVRAGQPALEPRLTVPLAVLSGGSVFTETVGINRPLTFRGVRFHFQSYGPALQVTAPEGGFGAAFSHSQAQQVTLPDAGLTLRVAHRPEEGVLFVEVLSAGGALLGSGSVIPGQEIEIGGIPIAFSLGIYTVWQVSRDPTFGLAVASAGLLLAAIVVSLWIPHRRLWIRLDAEGKAWMAGVGDWAGEFDTLASELACACCREGVSGG